MNEKYGITNQEGIEVDFLANGRLDLPDTMLSRLDIVVASVHYHFDLTTAAQTERFIRALEEDVGALGVEKPDHEPRATQFVPQMLEMIGTTEARRVLERVARASRHGPRAVFSQGALVRLDRRGK